MNTTEISAKEIRRLIRMSGLYMYQVADEIGIADPTITRWLRRLDGDKAGRILKAIDALTKQNKEGGNQ